jgi:hypothetical protein
MRATPICLNRGTCTAAATLLAVVAAVACGSRPPVAPNDTTQTSVSGGPAPGGTPSGAPSASTPTTTTPPVDDAGAGKKLEPTAASDAGPAPHQSDPGRSTKDIQAIVLARRDEARACYDKAYNKDSSIGEGNVDVRWVIDPLGNVTEIDVDPSKSTVMDPNVGKCIIEIIKKIKFNKSDRGFETRTHYPFNFHPKPGQGKDAGPSK